MAQIFLGNEQMRVDSKGRVGIPSRFMNVLRAISPEQAASVGLMITPERSVKIMPLPHFIEEVERLNRLDDRIAAERLIKNLAVSTAELATLDKQNRIKLSPLIMEMCGIAQQVVIAGSMHAMQIFDVDVYKAMFTTGLGKMSEAMEKVVDKENPKPAQPVKQLIINMADLEARAAENSTEQD